MNKKLLNLALVAIATMLMLSCSKTENGNVEYIPFQETDDGQWGMISMDGKVLFKDEFKNKPTIVRDGRFFVRTKEGVWEMYDASEKPKKIGDDYAHTSGFRNGRALVAIKNQPVSIIDTEGKIIKKLDKIENHEVDGVRAYKGNYAVFMTVDSLWGAIDKDGDCVVKPDYYSLNNCGDGKFIGVNAKYKKFVQKEQKNKVKISVINTTGKVLFDFSADKYENTQNQFTDGKLAISVKKDGKETWGIIDDKGEMVVKPSSKLKSIGSINGDVFTYNNGDGWGLMNIKGETLIRAKYEFLYYDEDKTLIAVVKDGDSYEYKYIDIKDNQIGDDTYVEATLYSMFDGKHAWVKPNDKIYSLIDKECKQIDGLPDIVNIGTYEGESYIESDFVDLEKLIAAFGIKDNGVMGFDTKSTPKEVVKKAVELNSVGGSKEHPAGTPYWFDYTNNITLMKDVNGVIAAVCFYFSGNLSRQTYKTQRIIDYEFDDYYWYHDNKIPTGYVWNKVTPNMFGVVISNEGRMHGKLRTLFNTFTKKFKEIGTIAKQNNGAIVFSLKNGMRAVLTMAKDKVSVFWGDLKPVKDIDISEYKDACEEDDLSNISYGYLNELFPDKNIIEADTTAVDTVVVD